MKLVLKTITFVFVICLCLSANSSQAVLLHYSFDDGTATDLSGNGIDGTMMNGAHVVDNGIQSYFALLTKKHEQHRWSIRFDDFDVVDRDTTPLDDNGESGHALTAAWRFEPDRDWSIGIEWRALDITRPASAYFGRPVSNSEDLVSFDIRYRLWSKQRRQ